MPGKVITQSGTDVLTVNHLIHPNAALSIPVDDCLIRNDYWLIVTLSYDGEKMFSTRCVVSDYGGCILLCFYANILGIYHDTTPNLAREEWRDASIRDVPIRRVLELS